MPLAIQHNIPLKPFNTLNAEVHARYYCQLTNQDQLPELLSLIEQQPAWMVLGGGSNLVLTRDFPGLVIHSKLKGIRLQKRGRHVLVTAAAGENWHELVRFTAERQLQGIENLSLIPGTVGAAPMQNIGAYGVELKDVFDSLTGIDVQTGKQMHFSLEECQFGYRESIFKNELKNRFIITSVSLRLNQQPSFQLEYGEIRQVLSLKKVQNLTPLVVSDAVCDIRRSKLPDPDEMPNVGSFFKNPIVSERAYSALASKFNDLVAYPCGDGRYKLAAGWLIDQLGWKGREISGAKVHDKQALVLINSGGGARAVLSLARLIARDVREKLGIELEIEPQVI